MKKPTVRKVKKEIVDNNESDVRKDTAHEVRKKIENILIERERKKLWDL
ncbi:hypothetical protein J4N45_05385 [Vibrio sp. SCSIO 43140]|nr:hypothetical protein [Vibrio sp. SCSIO 43140]USD61398.1 hypothetical protein J4N45_05385 [Vibrio sp. SCSIO 43140]